MTRTVLAIFAASLLCFTGIASADAQYKVEVNLGIGAIPTSINAAGDVVGYYINNNSHRPFLFSNGQSTDLGTFGGVWAEAHGINNSGDIALVKSDGTKRNAVLYHNGSATNV